MFYQSKTTNIFFTLLFAILFFVLGFAKLGFAEPNRVPVIDTKNWIPAQTLDLLGGARTFDLSWRFSDPDGDTLTYSSDSNHPNIVTVSVSNATLTITPVAVGQATIMVRATDPHHAEAGIAVLVNVVQSGAPVTVGSIPDQTLTVDGGSVTVDVSNYFSDPDGDTLSYAFSFSDPSKINTSVAGATVTFTPVAVGTSTVTVTATDPSNLSATQTFSVTVGEASNRAPVILATIPDQTLSIGETFTVNPKTYFSDPDGDTLDHLFFPTITPTVRLDIGPNGEGIFTALAAGTVEASVGVEDPGNLRVSQTFSITVIGAANNQPQPVGTIPAQTLTVGGGSATVDVSSYFSDPDGDALSYSFSFSDSSKINANVAGSTVIFAPIAAGSSTVTVTATDPDGLTATQTFTITVNKASNRAPVTAGSIPDQTLTVGGTAVSVDVSGYFSDPDGDALRYSSISGDPDIATVSVSGTTVTITPVAIGTTSVTVTASDQHLQESSSISVNVVGNLAPVTLGTISDQTLSIGETFTVNPNNYFRDPDGDTLTYTYHSSDTHIVGMTIDLRGGTFTANAVGTVTVRITAMDPSGLKTSANFSITVAGAPNASPQAVGSIPDQTLTVGGTSVSVDVSSYFSDPDGDALSYSFSFSDASRVNAVITGSTATLNPVAAGTITATATATDPSGLTATQSFSVTVNEPSNRAPVAVGSIPNQTLTIGDSGTTVDVSSHFSDADNDTLTYTASSSDTTKATVSVSNATVSIAAVAAGTVTITVTATDPGSLTATQIFSMTASHPNRAPAAVGTIPNQTVAIGGASVTLNLSSYFSDPDSDALTYTASISDEPVLPEPLVKMGVSNTLQTLSITARQVEGKGTITVTATDTGNLSVAQTFALTVIQPNRAPAKSSKGEIPKQYIDSTAPVRVIGIDSYFTDPDGDTLTYTAASSDTTVATTSVSGTTVSVSRVTAASSGEITITVTATDPSGLSGTRTFSVTVDPDPPNVSSNGSPEAIKLDINDDGIINILDLVLVANQIGQPATDNIADINADGVINILDLVLVANEL